MKQFLTRLFSAYLPVLLAVMPCLAGAGTQTEEAERADIEQSRREVEARYLAQEKSCYQKFAVSDCLLDIRAKRRVALEGLRKREVALHDVERRRLAEQQFQRTQEKVGEQAARDARAQTEPPRSPKEAAPPRAAPTSATVRRADPPTPRSAAAAAESQRRFEQKRQEALEHKAAVQKKLAEKPASSVKPLPDPP
jgi:pyruvate/2-oxoglutarate dehydrogenase complex dihydrolipoamide acyltransferase (E2) component